MTRAVLELKSFKKPPPLAESICSAVMVVLGEKNTKWDNAKEVMKIPREFIKRITEFNRNKVSDATMKKLQPFITNPDFCYEVASRQSTAAANLCNWVLAIAEYTNAKRSN
mmetsp:Transcript_17303/g.23331  ORF Transcript_17303/g.23331 Transcript_17303/m.23331 type:complete len:111 (+) Transcript_17303:974-1306(+)